MIWMALACIFSASFNHLIRNAQAHGRNMAWVGAWNYVVAALVCWGWCAAARGGPIGQAAAVYGLAGGFFFGAAYVLRPPCIRAAGVGITTMVSGVSVAVPILAAVIIWGEIVGSLETAGIVVALVAFPCLAYGRALPAEEERRNGRAPAAKRVGLLTLFFVDYGIATVFMEGFSHATRGLPGARFQLLLFDAFLFSAAAAVNVAAGAMPRARKLRPPDLGHGTGLGLVNVMSTFCLMSALAALPAADVFLTTSVGTVLLSACAATMLWRERYRGLALLGLGLGVIALTLVNVKL